MRSNASRAWATVRRPRRCACAVGDDLDGLAGLALDLGDQAGDLGGRGLGLLGELADLLGDDGEALALLAGAGGLDGGVERQQVGLLGDAGDGVDDAADLLRAWRQVLDRGRDLGRGLGDLAHRLGGRVGGVDALAGDRAGLVGGLRGLLGRLGADAPRRERPRRPGCGRTRRCGPGVSAPWATSPTAEAISSIARSSRSDVCAICCEAAETVPAEIETSVIVSASFARIAL